MVRLGITANDDPVAVVDIHGRTPIRAIRELVIVGFDGGVQGFVGLLDRSFDDGYVLLGRRSRSGAIELDAVRHGIFLLAIGILSINIIPQVDINFNREYKNSVKLVE